MAIRELLKLFAASNHAERPDMRRCIKSADAITARCVGCDCSEIHTLRTLVKHLSNRIVEKIFSKSHPEVARAQVRVVNRQFGGEVAAQFEIRLNFDGPGR